MRKKLLSYPFLLCLLFLGVPSGVYAMETADTLYTQNGVAQAPPVKSKPKRQPRKITPVENEDTKPSKPLLHYYDKHGNPLSEPVVVWVEDTVVKTDSKPKNKLYNGVEVGVNFFDLILKMAGQSYFNIDASATVSLYNWFFPTVEVGLGTADSKPANSNFKYKSGPSLYLKLGFDYNFLYNSNPDYRLFLGFRAGFSSFKYDVEDVTISSDYWDQTQHPAIRGQKSTAFYGDVLAGLKVRIYKRFSMGWTIRYHFLFNVKDSDNGSPWFIPGYGARNAHFGGTMSLIFDI